MKKNKSSYNMQLNGKTDKKQKQNEKGGYSQLREENINCNAENIFLQVTTTYSLTYL